MAEDLTQDLERILRASPLVSRILEGWHVLDLPDAWLVAGCIGQTVWNDRYGFAPTYGFRDVDLVYFDLADLSKAAEQDHAARIRDAFSDLDVRMPIKLDVKNEARVHLWYEQKFGYSIPPYTSVKAAIDTFPATAGCVGIRPMGEGNGAVLDIYAPYGLEDLMSGTVRANKKQITQEIYEAKVARWIKLWPKLKIIPWE